MRFLVTAEVPPEVGTEFENDPAQMANMLQLMESKTVEVAYISASRRAFFFVCNLDTAEQLATFLQPIWQSLNLYPSVDVVLNVKQAKESLGAALGGLVQSQKVPSPADIGHARPGHAQNSSNQ
ncbi:MAG TPA: hypothetical protein VLY65_00815 [Nitrososphaerales archaeon]|nr:hypothetical protein [Nitrososphaerales archaeon]